MKEIIFPAVEDLGAVVIELRARVETLEATQHAHVDTSHLTDAKRKQIREELARPATFAELLMPPPHTITPIRTFTAEEPVPVAPTDAEIEKWADAATEVPLEEMDPEVHGWRRCFTAKEFSETIRAAIALWGTPANTISQEDYE